MTEIELLNIVCSVYNISLPQTHYNQGPFRSYSKSTIIINKKFEICKMQLHRNCND